MILADKTIQKYIAEHVLVINPEPQLYQYQPSSLDLRLDYSFKKYLTHNLPTIDTKNHHLNLDTFTQNVKLNYIHEPFVIQPNEFVLAQTLEKIQLPSHITATVEGRSSFGRLGLAVHITAGYIDPGFVGNITLEIKNNNHIPIAIYPEQRICQIVFHTMDTSAENPYNNKYQGQTTPTVSKINEESL